MPKYPDFKNKPLKGVKEEDWGKLTIGHFNKIDSRHAATDYLLFKPELVSELAKDFTNSTQMVDYKGKNQDQIRSAGRLIEHKRMERPEWFEAINIQTLEEVVEEVKSAGNIKFLELSYALRQKLWRHFNSKEIRELFPNIQWERKNRSDDDFIEVLSQFKTASEMRNTSSELKNLLSRVMQDKGVRYPKAYELAESMKTGNPGAKKGKKRGSYAQRTPAIEQYDLDNNLVQVLPTWDDVINAGFKRSSVTSAIRGTDGHNRHKGFIWRHTK
jgi:hypothetical protein